MSHIFSGISETILIIGILDLTFLAVLSWQILTKFKNSLTSVQEKSAGLIFSYKFGIEGIFKRNFEHWNILTILHFICLHLVVPLIAIGLLLHSNWNFLAVVFSMIWSYQISIRIFPGYT